MNAEPTRGFRGFLVSKPGRALLLVATIGAVLGSFVYVTPVLAIPIFLILALFLPIYLGLKRPRYLALTGLVVLLVLAPLANVLYTEQTLAPPGVSSSAGTGPFEHGGAVLQNASLSPFNAASPTNFTWSVSLYPKFLASPLNNTNWSNDTVYLFISTCPGATTPQSLVCPGSYSFYTESYRFKNSTAPQSPTSIVFHDAVPAKGVWSWQMELVVQNSTDLTSPAVIKLVGDPTYDGLAGPIIGGFPVVYGALILTIFEMDFVYLGIPFFVVLLLYMIFKSREARHRDAFRRAAQAKIAAQASRPPGGPAGSAPAPAEGPAPAAVPPSPGPGEAACPSCGAVVYPKETKCWKCGASLDGPEPSPPLPSGPKP